MSEEEPRNVITDATSISELIEICEGHAEEENALIAKLFGKDAVLMNEDERTAAMIRLETIQEEMAIRNKAIDKNGGPIWLGM